GPALESARRRGGGRTLRLPGLEPAPPPDLRLPRALRPPAPRPGADRRRGVGPGGDGGAVRLLRKPVRRGAGPRVLQLPARRRGPDAEELLAQAADRGVLLGELFVPLHRRRRLVRAGAVPGE